MGLDDFATESSSSSTSGSSSTGSVRQPTYDEFPKEFWNGKQTLSEGHKKIIIEEEERWNKIITFIEDEIGFTEEELLEMEPEQSYNIVRNTIDKVILGRSSSFEHTRICPVCEKTFEFPDDWDFVEYEDEAYCEDHTLEEVKEANENEE